MDLIEAIRDNMRREWLETESSPECFDFDETRMASLLNFVHGFRVGRDVRSHLLSCCRCRYLYAACRATIEPDPCKPESP
jgi:hypothetical protein